MISVCGWVCEMISVCGWVYEMISVCGWVCEMISVCGFIHIITSSLLYFSSSDSICLAV